MHAKIQMQAVYLMTCLRLNHRPRCPPRLPIHRHRLLRRRRRQEKAVYLARPISQEALRHALAAACRGSPG